MSNYKCLLSDILIQQKSLATIVTRDFHLYNYSAYFTESMCAIKSNTFDE